MARLNGRTPLEIVLVKSTTFAWLALFGLGLAVSAARGGKKPSQTIAAADGKPIRKVYIRSASHDTASSAANQLAQDTCLVSVPDPKEADAVLVVGVALHAATPGASLATPNVFGPSARAQTAGNATPGAQRSVSTNCSDSSGGCTSSASGPAGDVTPPPAAGWPGNAGGNLDVSLVSPEKGAQQLWEPDAHSGKTWSHQLRIAAGCPVCSDEHFNRHKYKTYRNWMEDKCPTVLTASETQ